jgi:predicted RNase H-like HicB family nuclease
MVYQVEIEQEVDGRWIAEVVALPGVMTYGPTADDAFNAAVALALRVIAERLEQGEEVPGVISPGSQALDFRFARAA